MNSPKKPTNSLWVLEEETEAERPVASDTRAAVDSLMERLKAKARAHAEHRRASASHPKRSESRASESRASESRASESRASESRASESRALESRASEVFGQKQELVWGVEPISVRMTSQEGLPVQD